MRCDPLVKIDRGRPLLHIARIQSSWTRHLRHLSNLHLWLGLEAGCLTCDLAFVAELRLVLFEVDQLLDLTAQLHDLV